MNDNALLILGILFLIGGSLNIFLAEEYVRYVTSLYSVRTVRITGWVGIAFAMILIGLHFVFE